MSSHHIVREKQEPALLVLGLQSFPFEQLGQLLEWSPTVIATPLIAEELNSLGLKIDWIIDDNISTDLQSDVKHIPTANETLLDTGLQFLIANNYPSVNIVTDDFNFNDYQSYIHKINIVVFNNQRKIYAIQSNFSKWKPAGEKIELLTSAENLSFDGLESIGPNTYVTTRDGIFSLKFNGTFLFLAEET